MTEQKRAAGYVRVSSKEQTEGESLSTQRQSIRNFVKAQGWKLTNIYSDEGISGGSVSERHALLKCMVDGQNKNRGLTSFPSWGRTFNSAAGQKPCP